MKDRDILDKFSKWMEFYERACIRFVAVGIPVALILIIYSLWEIGALRSI